ncbi:hypothetical protein THII_2715 [Thioploca ingrica]|uniref:Uncharacterized protein n=1 Tax=Thioploca ingrica TaxID=40754 RepID=A0A090AM76_9GAMM|nr:hypothetical protein THII_2715 [Thioploca ingrica]
MAMSWLYAIIRGFHVKFELRSDQLRYQDAENIITSAYQYDISNLQFIRVAEHLRLSFDWSAKKIEVGDSLEEPDKEWLYERLQE